MAARWSLTQEELTLRLVYPEISFRYYLNRCLKGTVSSV
jgi:hypothetical protein